MSKTPFPPPRNIKYVAAFVQMLSISVSGRGHSAESAVHDKALRGFTKGRGNKNGTGGEEGAKGEQRQDSKGGKLRKRMWKGESLLGVNMTKNCRALQRRKMVEGGFRAKQV